MSETYTCVDCGAVNTERGAVTFLGRRSDGDGAYACRPCYCSRSEAGRALRDTPAPMQNGAMKCVVCGDPVTERDYERQDGARLCASCLHTADLPCEDCAKMGAELKRIEAMTTGQLAEVMGMNRELLDKRREDVAEIVRLREVMLSCADELHAGFKQPKDVQASIAARVRKRLEKEAGS